MENISCKKYMSSCAMNEIHLALGDELVSTQATLAGRVGQCSQFLLQRYPPGRFLSHIFKSEHANKFVKPLTPLVTFCPTNPGWLYNCHLTGAFFLQRFIPQLLFIKTYSIALELLHDMKLIKYTCFFNIVL